MFKYIESKDLLTRGGKFYAVWDEDNGAWSTSVYTLIDIIDRQLAQFAQTLIDSGKYDTVVYKACKTDDTGVWRSIRNAIEHYGQDQTLVEEMDPYLTFLSTKTVREDYSTKRLNYDLVDGPYDCWDKLIGVLYSPEERAKIEWAIGSIVSGDSKYIQKFIVLYGDKGTGKSTVLNILQMLFEGYYTVFSASDLGSKSNQFAAESFKDGSLLAIEHDADMSRLEDNTRFNTIVSHEVMKINEKYKSAYYVKPRAFIFVATNSPVRITDAKSGLLRRLIDVQPTGNLVPGDEYDRLMDGIKYQLGAIAKHCLDVYREMGPKAYKDYIPFEMINKTDPFYNFMLDNYFTFVDAPFMTLKQAWDIYKTYCEENNLTLRIARYQFKDMLMDYYAEYRDRYYDGDKWYRSAFFGFLEQKFDIIDGDTTKESKPKVMVPLRLLYSDLSILDEVLQDCPAQYGSSNETPLRKWADVKTTLKDIRTTRLHYVKVPENHIVIDFDLKDEQGNKSATLNLTEASKWPSTYAEFSKGGAGVHLHYIYDGDVNKLSRLYSDGIEIKVFTGNSSLRRKFTYCNNIPIAHISSGLPLKGGKPMVNYKCVADERHLRIMIEKNLRKEIHPYTTPSMCFIAELLDSAYNNGIKYDVTDLRTSILTFAGRSHNQARKCLEMALKLHYSSDEPSEPQPYPESSKDDPLVFFDCEVFPNLFVVCWKYAGADEVVKLINPTSRMVADLFRMKLVGFNNVRYDNTILYARYMGYNNQAIFELSDKIINGDGRASFFREAQNISYTDVWDYCSNNNRKSLKKWEIELGIKHQELDIPWDQPVDESLWDTVAEYCCNDVRATETVFNATQTDFRAREILAALSGLTVNNTTNQHTLQIIFGDDKNPALEYPDISLEFPDYKYENGKNWFRGEEVGFGGYVYSKPGMYGRVITLDVSGMHPASIIAMNLFGKYTQRFADLVNVRTLIKHKQFDEVSKMFDGKLTPYLGDPKDAKELGYALKIANNSVYGLTSAKFKNRARDERNVNNIVALRGALMMMSLRDELIKMGVEVIHIKTDSVKIVNPTQEIIDFVMNYGDKYGYKFEVEHVFEKICLVNDSTYVAKLAADDPESPGEWTATAAQFQVPYVFKSMFTREPITFDDKTVIKEVHGSIYNDLNENLPEGEHNYKFVGRIGKFCPILPGHGGGALYRKGNDGRVSTINGTKGFRWLEADDVKANNLEEFIDLQYFRLLVDEAYDSIHMYGDPAIFTDSPTPDVPPWCDPKDCATCDEHEFCQELAAKY